jgi:hypothetical protein
LTAGSIGQPDHGVVALEGSGVRYTPEAGWKGTTSFSVTVCDDLGQCVELTYEVTVASVKPAPSPTPSATGPVGPTPSQSTAPGGNGAGGSGQGGDGGLPFTGSGAASRLAVLAAALLTTGWLLLLTTRRRRAATRPGTPGHTD